MTARRSTPSKRRTKKAGTEAPRPVTAAELRALRREIEQRVRPGAGGATTRRAVRREKGSAKVANRPALRWNPETDDVQRSVAQLVLTIVEFLRQLMERQAIRRIGEKTLTRKEAEAVGVALMKLEETVQEIGKKFGLTAEDLNLDLGPLKLM